MSSVLFEDIFTVNEIDRDGKKFDKGQCCFHSKKTGTKVTLLSTVSRFFCKSENYDMNLTLDINSDIYPMERSEKFKLVLSEKIRKQVSAFQCQRAKAVLSPDLRFPQADSDSADSSIPLDDHFDYIMYGKIYQYKEEKAREGTQPKL